MTLLGTKGTKIRPTKKKLVKFTKCYQKLAKATKHHQKLLEFTKSYQKLQQQKTTQNYQMQEPKVGKSYQYCKTKSVKCVFGLSADRID